jgi:hypothetical protein
MAGRLSTHPPSPSFAQTGAEFSIDSDDPGDDFDLRSEVGGRGGRAAGSEVFELTPRSRGSIDEEAIADEEGDGGVLWQAGGDDDDNEDEDEEGGLNRHMMRRSRRTSTGASTAASFELYTPDEEKAVRRKFDRKLVLFVALLYMLSFLDRSSTLATN